MEYEIVIGLEVHAQLLTKSKMFCGCSTKFGEKPNTQTCPVCLGMPGVLPVINQKAIEFVLKTALALNCKINEFCRFARKHYYYPDMPKNYQISQYEQPLAEHGYIDIEVNEVKKRIGIKRVHLEEDVGKLIHAGTIDTAQHSYVDFNRSGIPLMEIVSEPDIRHPEEAAEYMKQLRMILQYLDVCDGNMEEGSLRCDANISIRPLGSQKFGTKTEVKNMNSFKNVQKALAFEAERQIAHVKEGGGIIQETRLWDADKEITLPMRSKEEAHDYRYFPEPDLVPLAIDEIWLNSIKDGLEELPYLRKVRFVAEYGIPEYDAEVLTASKAIANYYEKVIQLYPNPKVVSNWVMVELLRELKGQENAIEKCPVSPENLARMLKMIDEGIISSKIAKAVFEEMYVTSKSPDLIVKEKGLVQVSDVSLLEEIIEKVVSNNPEAVKDYLGGKERSFGFLVGQVMKATQGKANPQLVNKMLKEKIASLS